MPTQLVKIELFMGLVHRYISMTLCKRRDWREIAKEQTRNKM